MEDEEESSEGSSRDQFNQIPRDLFSCLICYESFGIDPQQQLVALKCGHMFCASCIEQWLTMNKVCPTCRKRCAMKDILYVDVSMCIVAYGKKKIENLSVERDRLKSEIQLLQELIDHQRVDAEHAEDRLRSKRRFLARLKYISRR